MAEGRRRTSHGDDVCRDTCWPSAKLGPVLGVVVAWVPQRRAGWGRASRIGPSMTRLALASRVSAE